MFIEIHVKFEYSNQEHALTDDTVAVYDVKAHVTFEGDDSEGYDVYDIEFDITHEKQAIDIKTMTMAVYNEIYKLAEDLAIQKL